MNSVPGREVVLSDEPAPNAPDAIAGSPAAGAETAGAETAGATETAGAMSGVRPLAVPLIRPVSDSGTMPFLQALSGGGHVGVLLLDATGEIFDVNSAGCFLLGQTRESLVGQSLGHIPGLLGESPQPIEINCVSADATVRFCELRSHRIDLDRLPELQRNKSADAASFGTAPGTSRDDASSAGDAAPETSAMPNIFVTTLYDVTPYREAATTAKNDVVRRDEFLATLSHELRNPLSAIAGGFELLRRGDLADDERDETIEVVDRQVDQLTRLLDDLLVMTRLTRNRLILKRERHDLRSTVKSAAAAAVALGGQNDDELQLMQAVARGEGDDCSEKGGQCPTTDEDSRDAERTERVGRIQLRLPVEPVILDGDPARSEQLVANLLVNALTFARGLVDVRLTVFPDGKAFDAPKPGCSVAGRTPDQGTGGVLQLDVCDAGSGIAAELLPLLFDPFVQAERKSGGATRGFGIGLTLVRDIVILHGGRVWAESDGTDRGARFCVQLPTEVPTDEERSEFREPSRGGEVDLPALRVLLVEDVPAIRKVTTKLLERMGHTVVSAADVPSALAAIEQHAFDLGVVDIGLPGPSGHTLAETLRRRDDCTQMRLVALTGYGQRSDREASLQAGFDAHLVKPFDIAVFREAIERLFAAAT